jgi:hypothetical protein
MTGLLSDNATLEALRTERYRSAVGEAVHIRLNTMKKSKASRCRGYKTKLTMIYSLLIFSE